VIIEPLFLIQVAVSKVIAGPVLFDNILQALVKQTPAIVFFPLAWLTDPVREDNLFP
jgi:hypothetical protein